MPGHYSVIELAGVNGSFYDAGNMYRSTQLVVLQRISYIMKATQKYVQTGWTLR